MPRIKHTAGLRKRAVRRSKAPIVDDAFEKTKGSCEGEASNENPIRFLNRYKERRFAEIKHWSFIPERKVQLALREYDVFLMGLMRRNWRQLADPLFKYDAEVVYEFYANAWAGRQDVVERESYVNVKWIPYDPKSINKFLGNLYPDPDEQCTYHRLKATENDFNNNKVAQALCIPNRSYQRGPTGRQKRIQRKDMRTLAQVWLTFMLANIVPIGHGSDLNVPHYNLLYSIIQEEYIVNVSRVIYDEIQKFVDLEVNQEKDKKHGVFS